MVSAILLSVTWSQARDVSLETPEEKKATC